MGESDLVSLKAKINPYSKSGIFNMASDQLLRLASPVLRLCQEMDQGTVAQCESLENIYRCGLRGKI